jgi:hypothetical protein
MAGDYMPDNDLKFNQFFKFMLQYVNEMTSGPNPKWTHIPPAAVSQFGDDYAAWYLVYGPTLRPHTPVETRAKNSMKKESKRKIRLFVNRYLRFPPVTEEDLLAMGVPIHDNKPTPIPAPTSQAEADLRFPGIHMMELYKIRKTGKVSEDPRSDYGVSIHFGILDAVNSKWRITVPPATGENLPYSVFTREKKILFDFNGESGKTIYFCLCYQNQKGGEKGTGPFGPILSAVIP